MWQAVNRGLGPLLRSRPELFASSRGVHDIPFYDTTETSHMHLVDSQSNRRKFLLKLDKLERDKAATLRRRQEKPFKSPSTLEPIELPQYKERGPTDVLKAMASGLSRDYTAPNYSYHDDPYLIPYSGMLKRDYLMAKDGGRRAAKYILDNHPELFEHNRIEMEPPIKAFMPKSTVTKKSASVELLMNFMESHNVADSMQTYEFLEQKGKKIKDPAVKQALLELVCFHNESEELSEDYNEIAGICDQPDPVWVQGGVAEKLYSELVAEHTEWSGKARLAILCGMSRHGQRTRAWSMYEECQANNVKLDTVAYNAVLRCVPTAGARDDFDQLWGNYVDILKQMSSAVDGQTLCATLSFLNILTNPATYKSACKVALSVLAEFKGQNILPTLEAYRWLLKIFTCGGKVTSQILIDVIKELESRPHAGSLVNDVMSREDFFFFRDAMDMTANRLNNLQLAFKVHQLAMNNNEVLIGDYNCNNNYYRNFMVVLLNNEPIDVAMEWYNKFTPHVWSPTVRFYEQLLREVDIKGASRHLAKIWTDLQASEFCAAKRELRFATMLKFLQVLRQAEITAEDPEEVAILKTTFLKICKEAYNEISSMADHRMFDLSKNKHAADICTELVNVTVGHGDFELAEAVVDFCRNEIHRMIGSLGEATLTQYVQAMCAKGNSVAAYNAVVYAAELKYTVALRLAKTLVDDAKLELTQAAKNQLNSLFSFDQSWTML